MSTDHRGATASPMTSPPAVALRLPPRGRQVRSGLLIVALGLSSASVVGSAPPDPGLYTSAIYESEAAMLTGPAGGKHGCMWKGRAKREGKVICKGGFQLRCGRRGWYKTGPC